MNKDVIYIDVDDDVTAIIGKIKQTKEKIVALVPPKRSGALQSAVNLRLLDRMAKAEKKQLVLITHNQALLGLAANAQIPVAKNLQSKPELAEIPALAVDDDDAIINGADLPVGDHAKTAPKAAKAGAAALTAKATNDIDTSELNIDGEDVAVDTIAAQSARANKATKPAKNRPKIPNFDTFRKKLFLAIGGGVALVALLIWMFVFAPAATVIITASTTPVPISAPVRLGGTTTTNFTEGVVSSISKDTQVNETIEFDATGQENVGDKATGTMQLTRTSVSSNTLTIPAGTRFTSGSIAFVSTEAATLSGTSIGPGGIVQDSATVDVEAVSPGENYNVSARSYQSSQGGFSAQGSAMTGGTTRIAQVVSAADIERAQGDLIGRSTDEQKRTLAESFTNGEVVIDSSFVVQRGDVAVSPAQGEEAPNGKATLTIPTTYTMQAVPRADLTTYLEEYLETQIEGEANQEIYETGAATASVSNFRQDGDTATATIIATGSVGPRIDETQVKEEVVGKRYGEVQQSLESQPGIQAVDVQFSYFWVRTVPNNPDKVTIEFQVDQNNE